MNSKRLVAALAGAVLVAAMAANSSAQQKQPLFPDVADASHASPQAKAFFHSLFTAKSAHKLEPLMAHFSKEKLTYIDAALGWPFYDYDSLKKVFAEFMPKWPEAGKSYPTRILGDTNSALVAFTDTPELFGGEIRILAAIDFKNGKVVRWIDYWDGRSFGAETAAKMRTPADKFPTEFREKEAGDNAAPRMREAAQKLHQALAAGDAAAAAALFAYDAVYEDMALRTQILGRLAIQRYLARSLAKLPQGAGSALAHVVGSNQGGGFEWRAGPAYAATVRRGITALVLDKEGRISHLITVWDSAVVGDAEVKALALLALE